MTVEINKPFKKIAFVLSCISLVLWCFLGTGASLAWFTDTSPRLNNIINLAEFDAEVLFKTESGDYEPIDDRTDVFDSEALYEPGYTYIAYFKINNNGDVPFDYQTAVIIDSYVTGINVFGETLILQEYLRFGIITGDSEEELNQSLATREMARDIATLPLNRYETSYTNLDAGDSGYMAIVIYMPEETGNDANYRGLPIPEVKLGISVNATQAS